MMPLKLRVFISQSKYVGVCIHAHVGIYEDACVVCVWGGGLNGGLFSNIESLSLHFRTAN